MIESLSHKQSFKVVGVMSGTSLDGLDVALVRFDWEDSWRFNLEKAVVVKYPNALQKALTSAIDQGSSSLKKLDSELGDFIGEAISASFHQGDSSIDFIASHGHTVFHQPDKGLTLQIGDGTRINSRAGLPVVNNFRAKDVSLGGQGAPLVPIGDRDLFGTYDYCLNLGGIANISYQSAGERLAADICPMNMALNALSEKLGEPFDDEGKLAAGGNIDSILLEELNAIDFLMKRGPKSLGYEDYRALWLPILDNSEISVTDKLTTFCEHVAIQVSNNLKKGKILCTGGGAYNQYFVSRLKEISGLEVVIPSPEIIEFKEAIVFAYLGLLRVLGQPNCLASVTGAEKDNLGGDLYGF